MRYFLALAFLLVSFSVHALPPAYSKFAGGGAGSITSTSIGAIPGAPLDSFQYNCSGAFCGAPSFFYTGGLVTVSGSTFNSSTITYNRGGAKSWQVGASSNNAFVVQDNTSNSVPFAVYGNSVGVNITSSSNIPGANLQVSGTFIVSNSSQVTTPSIYVNSIGNVGIGTITPTTLLEVNGTVSATTLSPTTVFLTNGTAAVPSLGFGASTNLGLFRASAGVLGITAGGTQVARIANTTWGLMTTNVPSATFQVAGNTGTALFNGSASFNKGATGTSASISGIEVSGTIQVSNTGVVATCTTAIAGSFRYVSSTSTLALCTTNIAGTFAWYAMASTTTSVAVGTQ